MAAEGKAVAKVNDLDVAAEGKAVAKVNDLVIFVPYVVPGDVVDLQVKRKKNHYAEAVAVKLHEKSPMRVEPFCEHYGVCGGCKWQCLAYADQIRYKQKHRENRIAGNQPHHRFGKDDVLSQ